MQARNVSPDEPAIRETASDNAYVVPMLHTRIPEPVVDVAFWAALGVVAVAGAIDLPAAGALAIGLLIVRRRH